jgi:polyhydroxyalkanoate synthesis regulator phasin
MEIPTIQQLIDAGVEFTEVSRNQADAFVKQLVDRGEVQRQDAERVVKALVDRGRETSERIAATVQREVSKQVGIMTERFDELEQRFEALTEMLVDRVPAAGTVVRRSSVGVTATGGVPVVRAATQTAAGTTGARSASAKKSAAKKSTAKKSTAKKSTAKKSTAKKSGAKKSAAKKSTAKKASGAAGS